MVLTGTGLQQQQTNWTERTGRLVYKITIKTEEGIRDRVRHRARDLTSREKQPYRSGPVRQRDGKKKHIRTRQTIEADKRPAELKPPPIPTGRNEQNRSTHHYRRQHDRHGNPPCY